jgi:hypothetical protein
MLITEKRMRGGMIFSAFFFSVNDESRKSPLAAAPDLMKSLRNGMLIVYQ